MEINNFDDSIKEDIQDYLERIKRAKQKMDSYDISKFYSKVTEIQRTYENNENSEFSFNKKYMDYINDITEKINRHTEISHVIDENVKAYNEEFEKLNSLLKNEITELDSDALLTEEEIKAIREDYLNRKISISNAIIQLRDKIEALRKEIAELEEQIDREDREFEYASSIGITKDEYKEMMDNLKSKELVDTILSSKGVLDIAKQKATERTEEEKEKLATVRNSIRDEIAAAIATHAHKSVLDAIQFLYNNDQKVERVEKPREISISRDDLNNITINITININVNPVKVAGKDQKDYVPKPAPKDMTPKPEKILKPTEPEKRMNNEASIAELREAIDALDKAIKSVKALEEKNLPTGQVDIDGLVKLYNNKKDKYDELFKKLKTPKDIMKSEENNKTENIIDGLNIDERVKSDKKDWDNIDKTSDTDDKRINYVDKYYRELSNMYDKTADERIELINKYGKDSKEVAKINEKLKELSEEMKEQLEFDKKFREKLNNIMPDIERKNDKSAFIETPKNPTTTPEPTSMENRKEIKDLYTIFLDSDKAYVRKETFDRFFGKHENIEEQRIDGALCYSITDAEKKYIEDNKDNETSPYDLRYVDVHLGKTEALDSEEITLYKALDDNGNIYATEKILKMFGITPSGDPIDIYADQCYKISKDEDEEINNQVAASEDPPMTLKYHDVYIHENSYDEIILYRDIDDNNQVYASEEILKRFGIDPSGDPVNIHGKQCYKIHETVDRYIHDQVDASEKQIIIKYEDIHLKETIILYRDLDDNEQVYASEAILKRFGITPTGPATPIKGETCYKITPEEDEEINRKAKESELPKIEVEYQDVHLKRKEENIVIYKAVDEDDQLYTTKDVFEKFGLTVDGDPTDIYGKECYKVTPEQDKEINKKAEDSKDPIIHVQYVPIKIKKQTAVPIHYQEVIDKITKELDIKAKDGKRYRASNIRVWQSFKDELKSGNYLYNIVHFVPAVIKAGMNLIRKAASKIMLTARGRKVGKEIEKRLNGESDNKEYNLNEEDLEVLWNHYNGRNLLADKNNQINPIILQKLREYGLKKAQALNEDIKQRYLAVIATYEEIEKQKEAISKIKDEKKKEEEITKLRALYKFAADHIKVIQDKRQQASDLLSNGVHGMEEDFKAVETKMNYLGLKFGKDLDFDNELQGRLAKAGHKINEGIAKNDDEELFTAFIDYEKLYYENTEVKGSIFGKRSTGMKWYSPLPEMMDYRDDPFIKDFFTTMATVGAAINLANGIITHCIKDQQFRNQVNNDINATNQANMQYHNAVQQGVQNIQGQRAAEIEGLQAEIYKDLGYGLNTGERGILDKANWDLSSGGYHADDAILHSEMDNIASATASKLGSIALNNPTTATVTSLSTMESNLMTTINNALQPLQQFSKAYAQGHSFAYDAHLVPLDWFAQHPNAFTSLGDALTVINNTADTMALLSPSMMHTIGTLPSDLATTIAGAVTSLALVRSTLATAKSKANGKNADRRKGDIGTIFGQKIMGEEPDDKELEEMMEDADKDDDKDADKDSDKGASK